MDSVVVINHEQLAEAIADPDVNTIIFGADIELEGGIRIPGDKDFLIFDGEHDGSIHNFTDMDSILSSHTLHVDEPSDISLTFRNMTMTGRNYFGIPCIYETVATSGVSVYYENITYTGPQLAFNSLGLTRFKDCNITILPPNGNEVGEVCRVEFEGESTISHNSTNDTTKAVFWLKGESGSSYFRLAENAKLTVDTTNYFINTFDVIAKPAQFQLLSNSEFTLNSHSGFSFNSSNQLSSLLVDTGASLRYVQEVANLLSASLYINDSLTVNEGASVYMQADFSSLFPIIQFSANSSSALSIINPKSFVLYSSSHYPLGTSVFISKDYSITAEQINHWTEAAALSEAGGFDDTPQSKWHNPGWEPFSFYGVIGRNSTSVFSSDLPNPQFPISDFNFQSATVISAGNLLIEPDPVIDNGRPITGLTEPDAKLIISFTAGGREYSFDDVQADAGGRFELDPEMQLPIGTPIDIKVNTPFLIKEIVTTVVSAGEVAIVSAPTHIVFKSPPVSANPLLLRRQNPEEAVELFDSRPYASPWELSASISGPLTSVDGDVLEGAVVFKDLSDELWDLSGTPLVVRTGGSVTGPTDVYWPVDKGILVRIDESIRSGTEYKTTLGWSLEVLD